MAIKGKRKPKQRRTVTAGPKPVYVQPPKPLFRRRWFRFTALGIVVAGAVAGLVLALLIKSSHDRRAHEKQAVQVYGTQLDRALQGVGQPTFTTFQAFPNLTGDLGKLQSGALSPAEALKTARGYFEGAKTAYAAVQAIDAQTLIQDHPDLLDLVDSQNLAGDALQLYQQVATTFRLAARATGAERAALIKQAQSLVTLAQKVFDQGYTKLANERSKFGLLASSAPPPVPSVQPTASVIVSFPPTPSPSASPSTGGAGKSGKKHKK